MSRLERQAVWNLDWILLTTTVLIAIIGIMSIYSATYLTSHRHFVERQSLYIIIGIMIAAGIVIVDYRRILPYQSLLFWFSIGLLLYLEIKGGVGGKVDRYLKIWILPTITPSEFLKFALILRVAHHFRGRQLADVKVRDFLSPIAGFFVGLGLILKQPDLGTALLLVPVFIAQIFIAGYDYKKILGIIILGSLVGFFTAQSVLKPYQYERLVGFTRQGENSQETGWQLRQSKVAIGSGGFWGRGYLNGTQAKLEFLPAKHTDFILAVFAEEWGFIGIFGLFSLYIVWLWRGLKIARMASGASGLLAVTGVCTLFALQFIINAGMIVGLLPITGITLPFMSYGGSSILTNMICLGVVLSVGVCRT